MENMGPAIIGAVVSFIISVAVGIYIHLNEKYWRRTAGKVIAIHEKRDVEGMLVHAPSIEFLDRQGKKHSFTHHLWGSGKLYQVGKTVLVVHNPKDPRKAHLNSFAAKYFACLMILFIGFMFVLACFSV